MRLQADCAGHARLLAAGSGTAGTCSSRLPRLLQHACTVAPAAACRSIRSTAGGVATEALLIAMFGSSHCSRSSAVPLDQVGEAGSCCTAAAAASADAAATLKLLLRRCRCCSWQGLLESCITVAEEVDRLGDGHRRVY